MSDYKKVIKNSGIYGVVSVLQKAIGFFLLPLYTAYLTTADYGTVSVVTSLTSFYSIFFTLSLDGAITRFYYDYKDDKEKLKEFWGSIYVFILVNSIIWGSALIIFHKFLLNPFAKGINFMPYLLIGVITILLSPTYNIFQGSLQARQVGMKYGLNNLIYFVINLVLTILLVVNFKMKAVGVLTATLITNAIFFIYSFFDFLPDIKFKINFKYLKDSLKYSLPILPHSLSGWFLSMLDRIFLNNMKSTSVAGVYNIGFQFGNIINIFTTAVNQAYVPWFFENMKSGKEGRNKVVKFAENAVVIYCLCAICLSFFGKDVLKIMVSKDYTGGWMVIPFLSFAYVFNGIYYFFVNPLFYNKKGTKYIAVGTFAAAILNTILNYVLVPKFSMIGSSLASLLSMATASLLMLGISNKIENVHFKWLRMYAIAVVSFFISLINFVNININYVLLFIIKLVIFTIIVFVIYIVYKDEIKKLVNMVITRR